MTSPFRRAVGACLALSACCTLIIANRPIVHASDGDARTRGAAEFHAAGCERCHSITGVGGDRAPDLGSVGQRRNEHQIRTQILHGGHGMPPFEHVLSKDQVNDLASFLASCRTDTAPGCRQWLPPQSPQ